MIDYSCLIAYSLLGSQLLMFLIPKKNMDLNLNIEQSKVYNKIKKERLFIFIGGILLGILFSHLLLPYININDKKCYYISFTLLFTHLFYKLYPKSIYLLNILNSKDQINSWLEFYKYMQWRSNIGILLSAIAIIFIIK